MSDVKGLVPYQPGSAAAEHRRHDRLLIARHVANDLVAATEREQAASLVRDCPECAALATDLMAVARATRELAVPARPRDFSISAEQAARLRRGPVDRLIRRVGMPGLGYLRPLAAATMAIGLVLAAIGWLPVGLPMMASAPAAAPAGDMAIQPTSEAQHPPSATELTAVDGGRSYAGAEGSGDKPYPEPTTASGDQQGTAQAGDPLRTLLIFAGLALAFVGLGTLTLVGVGRRRLNDPLLR
jgi:hypothetical protein